MFVLPGNQSGAIYTVKRLFKGYCTPKSKLACFVANLKIINTFFEE